jgi:nickel superoxide dismutase
MRYLVALFTCLSLLLISLGSAIAHCQMPCGIYDDHLRIQMIGEDAATIEKGMHAMDSLSTQAAKNYNQIVRWVVTKEEHADKIQEIVSQYFLAQRIKAVDPADAAGYKKYIRQLELLHGMLVSAMKCKQTTDPGNVKTLRSQLTEFEKLYFAGEAGH